MGMWENIQATLFVWMAHQGLRGMERLRLVEAKSARTESGRTGLLLIMGSRLADIQATVEGHE